METYNLLLFQPPDAENKGKHSVSKILALVPPDQLLLWPRRVKEEASKDGVLGFMIRVNCKPHTRPQTKGSGVAPPTVGRAG